MSKEHASSGPSLHIEWAPGRVHAVDVVGNRRRTAASIGELTTFLSGQKNVLVGISRQLVFLKVVSLPRAAKEDLRRILTIQLGQHFPLPSDQLAFDFHQTNVRLDDGYETLIAAVRAEDLRQLATELQAAGIRAARVLPVALGSSSVATHASRTTALVIEHTEGIGHTIDVVADGVVRLSRMAPDASSLEREVQRTVAASGVENPTLIVAGPMDSTEGAAAARLGGAVMSARTALDLLQEAPGFHLELAEQRELERRKRQAAHNRLATLFLVSALCLVGLVWKQRSDEQAKVTAGQGRWAAIINRNKSISDAYTKKAVDANKMSSTLKSAFTVAQPLGDVASVVGDNLPKGAWLTALTLERGKLATIRGTATDPDDVARFLKNLSDSGRFRDVRLVVANSGRISSTPIVQFSVSAFPVGNLPMPAPEIKKAGARPATATSSSTATTPATGTTEARS